MHKSWYLPVAMALSASCSLLVGCRRPAPYMPVYSSSPAPSNGVPQYSFGVPPIRHIRSLWDHYAPLIEALNDSKTGFNLKLESGQTADTYDAKLRATAFDFALVDPYQVLVAEDRGYTVIARTGKADRIQGVIIVARDGEIHRVRDLQGRTIAFTNSTALAATLLNQYELFERGLDVRKRSVVTYTHSPETSLLSVSLNRAEAAAVSASDWEEFRQDHREAASRLIPLRQTDDLSGPAVMASRKVPPLYSLSLQAALIRLSSQPNGRAALERAQVSEFRSGDSVSYDDVWDFLQRYKQTLGPWPDRITSR
ncbi:MAG TPA: PhnD/SsuA/transferrin family substrate-binding protein [Bryobacteraceae bacterium]|nr:PhnD/SsuA/transferrin family substrate-binding protein [Bryobacteraceae bacterium]